MILIIDTKSKLISNNDSESLEEFLKALKLLQKEIDSYSYVRLKSSDELKKQGISVNEVTVCDCKDTEMWHLLTGMCCRCNKPTR